MNIKKLIPFGVLVGLLVLGLWLISNPTRLQAETQTRFTAVRAMAAAGAPTSNTAGQPVSLEAITPVVVNLADVPLNVYNPNNLYDRWLNGEVDLDESEYRISRQEVANLQQEALTLSPNSAIQIAQSGPGLSAPAPGIAFDSLDYNESSGGYVPPDPEMAAGPNHLIAVVNVSMEIYDKSGTSLSGVVGLNSFFSSLAPCVAAPYGAFDPNVVYDEEADRWIIAVDGNGTHYCIAVSQTANPTGAYNMYAVPAQPVGGEFHDYPHTGVGDNYIVVGANQFDGAIPGGFEGRVWALDKAAMYAGGALTPVTFSAGYDGGTPQPLHLHGYAQGTWPSLGNTHYFATDFYDGCRVDIWQWNIPAAPTIVSTYDLCTATGIPGGMPVNAPQSGGGLIQANDFRMRGFEYYNGSGWITDSISCNPGGGTVDCVRWHEVSLSGGTPSLVQAGVYASTGEYRIFPDLAVNKCNDMVLGYTKTSSSMFPATWYTGRESGDPLGTLQAEAQLKAGEIAYVAFDGAPYRWGDYTGMTIDPDGVTFWYLGQYSKNTGTTSGRWGNYIGSFTYPDCGISVEEPLICNGTPVAFESGIPTDWMVVDNEGGSPVFWSNLATCGEAGNYTGGAGDAACASSDVAGAAEFDTELWSSSFDLTGFNSATLNYLVNYQNFANLDFLNLDISTDGGTVWTNLLSWNEDHGAFRNTPGETVSVDLSAYAGLSGLLLRWHYYDPNTGDWDWYAQVDDVSLTCANIALPPAIEVDPAEIVATQPVTTTASYPLTISNTGEDDLDWTIDEESGVVVSHGVMSSPPVVLPPAGAAISRGNTTDSGTPITYYSLADFSEDFADITNLPGWFMQNNSAPLGSTNWFQGNSTVFPAHAGAPTAYIGANFNNTSGVGTISNWLLTPQLTLNDGDTLSFWTRTAAGSIWPDRLQVRLSTAGASTNVGVSATDVGDFTTLLLDINDTYTVGGYPEAWTQFTVTLSGIPAGATGRFALRYFVENAGPSGSNSNYIGIDTVEYVSNPAPSLCGAPTEILWASVSPTSGTTAGGDSDEVMVTFDTTGLTVGETYTGTLCINSNDPVNPLVTVPLTLTVEAQTFGVELVGDMSATAEPTETVTYTLAITNTGNVTETFAITVTSGWAVAQSDTSVTLAVGGTTTIWVAITVPADAEDNEIDVATVTATSQSDSNATDSVTLTTTASVPAPPFHYIYLPIILKP